MPIYEVLLKKNLLVEALWVRSSYFLALGCKVAFGFENSKFFCNRRVNQECCCSKLQLVWSVSDSLHYTSHVAKLRDGVFSSNV